MDRWFDRLEGRWLALPLRRQRTYTLYFFSGYVLLTAGVILSVVLDTANADNNSIAIEPIENPLIKEKKRPTMLQDTVSTIVKEKRYERK